ncbi:hypothetical protein NQZ68_039054, partial [Dissostichus eleginoides]
GFRTVLHFSSTIWVAIWRVRLFRSTHGTASQNQRRARQAPHINKAFVFHINYRTDGKIPPGQGLCFDHDLSKMAPQISDVHHQHLRPCCLAMLHWLSINTSADRLQATINLDTGTQALIDLIRGVQSSLMLLPKNSSSPPDPPTPSIYPAPR